MDSLLLQITMDSLLLQITQFHAVWAGRCRLDSLDLKGEVTDATHAPQLQLHLTDYKSNKSLESSVGSTERCPRPSWWISNCSRALDSSRYQEKGTGAESVWPKVDGFNFYLLSGLSAGQKYLGWNTEYRMQRDKKTPGQFWKNIGDCP